MIALDKALEQAIRQAPKESRNAGSVRAFAVSLILLIFSSAAAFSAELRLTVDGIRSDSGEILIGLYDNEEGFQNAVTNAATRGLVPDSRRLVGMAIRAKHGTQSAVFTQLDPGRYALIVIHDENDNGRLDEVLGVPSEGYGFGNDARNILGAPTFDAAAITVRNDDISTFINLVYPMSFGSTGDSDNKSLKAID